MPYHDSNYERSWKMQTTGVTLYPVTLARLYAAAPEMLAACREMAEIIHSMSESGVGLADGAAAPYMAVIAKAEGRDD